MPPHVGRARVRDEGAQVGGRCSAEPLGEGPWAEAGLTSREGTVPSRLCRGPRGDSDRETGRGPPSPEQRGSRPGHPQSPGRGAQQPWLALSPHLSLGKTKGVGCRRAGCSFERSLSTRPSVHLTKKMSITRVGLGGACGMDVTELPPSPTQGSAGRARSSHS